MDAHAIRDLELSIIGGCLLHPETVRLLTLAVDDFSDLRAQAVWRAMAELDSESQPIDLRTVEAQLGSKGIRVVGMDFLAECELRCPTVSNVEHYASLVREAAQIRRIRIGLADLGQRAGNEEIASGEILGLIGAFLAKAGAEEQRSSAPIGSLVRERVAEISRIHAERERGGSSLTGFPTGVVKLDEKLGGVQPGIVTIVAARPGMGKSSLGLSIADASSAAGYGVEVFSLEDTRDAYSDRSLSRESGVPASQIRACNLNRGELEMVRTAIAKLDARKKAWNVDDRSGLTADEIVRSVRRRARENKTRVVIVDYIQLVSAPQGSKASRHEQLTDAVTVFANAAKTDRMAYVVMSQLNRQLEARQDKRPMQSDLRESGSLEERAKCVLGLYRGSYYGPLQAAKPDIDYDPDDRPFSQEAYERIASILVLKASNGPTGTVWATWDGPLTKIS